MVATTTELEEIREVFGLSRTEIADLLGRRPQSLIEWETRGVPAERRASLERLLDLAQLFRRRVIASRIPESCVHGCLAWQPYHSGNAPR